MWLNYLKIGFRNLLRYRGSNFVNIFGLTFGLACCILCYLHIDYELSYDQFHEKGSRIFRVVTGDLTGQNAWVKISAPIPPLLKLTIPEVEKYTRFSSVSYSPKVVVEVNGNAFSESWFMMADPAFLQMFSFPLVKGQAQSVLQDLNSVVITESIARKLFGQEDAIGKVIKLKDNNLDFQVTGIAADIPGQSHLTFDYLISFENLDRILGEGRSKAWGEFNYFNYFLLNKNADKQVVEDKIHKTSIPSNDGKAEFLDKLSLQPLRDVHFQFNLGNMMPTYDKKYIYIFSAVAISLLLITCINYINLAIALSIRRIKEIGIRKVVGAGRIQLTLQFMSESFFIILVALMASLLLLEISLPFLNSLLNSDIDANYHEPSFLAYLLLIVLAVGLISGSYLSFYANSYTTASILKGAPRHQHKGFSLQHMLVLAQFCISGVLIISSLVIADQLDFIQQKNIGMDYQQVVNVPLYSKPAPSSIQLLKGELKKDPGIMDVTASSFTPGRANWHQTVWWEGQTEPVYMYILVVDGEFIKTMHVELLEGNVDEIASGALTGSQYLINESALKIIGWDKALGRPLSPFGQKRQKPVSGVIQDFNFKSLHHGLDPLVVVVTEQASHNQMFIRLAGDQIKDRMAFVEATFKKVIPDVPFEFEFLDEKFNQLYKSEIRLGRVITGLTALSVFFSLMGLYGLISFNIENKTKEIAVRKALGISLTSLMILFSKDYFRLLLAGSFIAIPLTYFLINSWLTNFSYKVTPSPSLFVGAYVFIFVALTVLIGLKSFAFRKINPAEALKYE